VLVILGTTHVVSSAENLVHAIAIWGGIKLWIQDHGLSVVLVLLVMLKNKTTAIINSHFN